MSRLGLFGSRLCIAFLFVAESSVVNILKNGDFEKVTGIDFYKKDTGKPIDWTWISSVNGSTFAKTGSFSALVMNSTSNSTCFHQSLKGNFSGKTFLISGWFRPCGWDKNPTFDIHITTKLHVNSTNRPLTIGTLSHNRQSWKRFMHLFTFPLNLTSHQIRIAVETGTASPCFNVDALAMEAYDPLSNYLRNGDFEDTDISQWDNRSSSGLKRSSKTSQSGNYSLQISRRTKGVCQVVEGLISQHTYAVALWLLAPEPRCSIKVNIVLEFTVDTRRKNYTVANAHVDSETWIPVTASLFLPKGSAGPFRMYAVRKHVRNATCKLNIDNFILTQDWRTRANFEIAKNRKRDVELFIDNSKLESFSARINQIKLDFPLGSAVNYKLISDTTYRETFLNNFNFAAMEGEMKWATNERVRDKENFREADDILAILEKYKIPCRGHTVFGAMKHYLPDWLGNLSRREFRFKLRERAYNMVSHFRNRVVSWDVHNEFLHASYIRDKLHTDAIIPWLFHEVRKYDREVDIFVNDYDVLRGGTRLEDYLRHIGALRAEGVDLSGVGAQGHFKPHEFMSYDVLRRRLDRLATTGLPIWLSEVDIQEPDEAARADKLELVMKTGFSHPGVEGLLLWGFWGGTLFFPGTALWETDWRMTAAGQRWRSLLTEWRTSFAFNETDTVKVPGSDSFVLKFRGFCGLYDLLFNGKLYEFRVEPGSETKVVRLDVSNATAETRNGRFRDETKVYEGGVIANVLENYPNRVSLLGNSGGSSREAVYRELYKELHKRNVYIILECVLVLTLLAVISRVCKCQLVRTLFVNARLSKRN